MLTSRSTERSAFSLIELLVVIAIISILSGLIFAGVGKVKDASRRTKCKVQLKQIEKAFVAYHDEYGEWPRGMTSYDNQPEGNLTGIEMEEKCALMLAATGPENVLESHNDRRVAFLPGVEDIGMSKDGSWSKRGFLDPWGHCYKYMIDFDDNGIVTVQFTGASGSGDKSESVSGHSVVVWSRGPDGMDGQDANGKIDDITSWKMK